MAAKYGMLPSEVLAKGTTQDIQIHIGAETYKERMRQKASGGDVGSTYSQTEINEIYSQWQKTRSTSTEADSKRT